MLDEVFLIDTGICNLTSVVNALNKLEVKNSTFKKGIDLTQACNDSQNYGLIIPGVGSFKDGMTALDEADFIASLHSEDEKGTPLLGICLGMQLLVESSEESPGVDGLGLIPGHCKKLPSNPLEPVPNIGWHPIQFKKHSYFTDGENANASFYFVHSYAVETNDAYITGSIQHCQKDYSAIIEKDQIFGVQFHPEKSQDCGLKLIDQFINWNAS
ncbi:MAG: imidazole glycerol phosphate synthase subunit HisH [Opitutae bacterium]|jgi:imidazole glycerol-phosphate synthase subunit HisH|nr:imidazole glycerol phosphate synthase subunit HisH [Opitutae bacterium]